MKKICCVVGILFVVISAVFSQTAADEILKWKQLLDSGAITEEEYQTQKNKILESGVTTVPTANQKDADAAVVSTIEQYIKLGLEANKYKIATLAPQLSVAQKQALYEKYSKSWPLYFVLNIAPGLGIGSFAQGDAKGGLIQLGLEGAGLGLAIGGAYNMSPTVMVLGMGVMISGFVVGGIAPWKYATTRNALLRNALNMKQNAAVQGWSFAPIINPTSDQYGLVAKIVL